MTQKDYIRLARALRNSLEDAGASIEVRKGVTLAAMRVGDELANERSQFNREKFLKAIYGRA